MTFPKNWIVLNPTSEERSKLGILLSFKGVKLVTFKWYPSTLAHIHIGCINDHGCLGPGLYNCSKGAIEDYKLTVVKYEDVIKYYSELQNYDIS